VLNSIVDTSFEGIRKILKDDPILNRLDVEIVNEIINEKTIIETPI
jgi:hypothetical protein